MAEAYHLSSDCLSLVLHHSGALLGLQSSSLGHTCLQVAPERAAPLCEIWTAQEGAKPLQGLHFTALGDASDVLTVEGTVRGLRLTVGIVLRGERITWRLRLANEGSDVAERLRFQIAGPLNVGSAPSFTYPFGSGWRLPLSALNANQAIAEHYPVHAAMQWIDLYGPRVGLYLAVEDPLPYRKTFIIGRRSGDPVLAWEFPDLELAPGQAFDFPPIHLVLHAGDWRSGADLYRAWAGTCFADPDVPPWYAALPAWNWVGFRGQFEPVPWFTASDLASVSERTAALGPELIQLTAYTEHGHDTDCPDYVVGSSYGGDEGMRSAMGAVHAAHRRLSIYTNGRLVDPASSLPEALREAWGVRTRPGGPVYRETYGRVTFDVMCPGAQPWQELFIDRLADLIRRYDVDGIYIDQVCGCFSLPCFAPSHTHARPNEAWAAYVPFLRRLRSRLRGLKPDILLATEGVCDAFAPYFDSQQSHEDWARSMEGRGELLPELYRYTYPNHVLNVGCVRANEPFYLRLGHTLGSGFDFGISEFNSLRREFVQEVRWVLAQRRRYDAVLRMGRFVPVLPTDCEGYRANGFVGRQCLVIMGAWLGNGEKPNPRRVTLTIAWPFSAPPGDIVCSSPKGIEPCRAQLNGGELLLELPADCGPMVAVCHTPQTEEPSGLRQVASGSRSDLQG